VTPCLVLVLGLVSSSGVAKEIVGASQGPGVADVDTEAPSARRTKIPGRGLARAGWVVLGAGYLVSGLMGIVIGAQIDIGYYSLIPLAGPAIFGGLLIEDSYDGYEKIVLTFGILFMLPSLVQLIGLVLATVGHTRMSKWKKKTESASFTLLGPRGTPGFCLGARF
jgi:hypothetical protein